MPTDFAKGLEEAKAFADEHGLSIIVYGSSVYIQDGGKRSWACSDGCTYDGHTYEGGFGMSSREASEAEIEMWAAMGGPT
jgi:hypothetical protein